MTISQTLINAIQKLKQAKIPTPRLDAEILLSHILKKPREFLFTHPNHKLNKSVVMRYALYVTQRAKGEPVAYITGHKEFYGLDFFVNKNVLIPRPETELLVDEALKEAELLRLLRNRRSSASACIIDVGTGSGCIVITLVKKLNLKSKTQPRSTKLGGVLNLKFIATDISKPALIIARKNAKLHHVDKKIKFLHGNLLEPILNNPKYLKHPNNPIIITANLPYLNPTQIKKSPSIQREPKLALSAGHDGLKYYRQLFKQIKKLNALRVMSYALCEIDPRQIFALKQLIKKILPKAKTQIKKDLRGLNRLVIIKS